METSISELAFTDSLTLFWPPTRDQRFLRLLLSSLGVPAEPRVPTPEPPSEAGTVLVLSAAVAEQTHESHRRKSSLRGRKELQFRTVDRRAVGQVGHLRLGWFPSPDVGNPLQSVCLRTGSTP